MKIKKFKDFLLENKEDNLKKSVKSLNKFGVNVFFLDFEQDSSLWYNKSFDNFETTYTINGTTKKNNTNAGRAIEFEIAEITGLNRDEFLEWLAGYKYSRGEEDDLIVGILHCINLKLRGEKGKVETFEGEGLFIKDCPLEELDKNDTIKIVF
jgi:hypothetical protein